MSLITIQNLEKSYNDETVLNIPQLSLIAGTSLGLVGNNGAGKTTLFRCVLDLIQPDAGEVHLDGVEVAQSEEWKKFTGSFIDEGFLIDYFTADEYFNFIAKLHNWEEVELSQFLDGFDELFKGEVRGRKKYIRDLSKGNQKKVGIVGALIGNPRVLVLDEPFANLDPSTQYQLRDRLKKLDEETAITMLISSHDLGHVTEFCQRIVILDHGEVVKDIRTNSETLHELENFFVKKVRSEGAV
ncbi:MAG: ABC transporter ATP-binding protein [Owenweeksia sp.]|nr:ABC transporter ATP-binding protein [Owenweeksia sp.]